MAQFRLHAMTGLMLAAAAGPAMAQVIQPLDLPAIQGQYNSSIQQQNFGTQLNTFRIEQGVNQDRVRELDLFRPQQPFGAGTYFQPQPPGVVPLPQSSPGAQQPYVPPRLPAAPNPSAPRAE
jgi:hypothetical protein